MPIIRKPKDFYTGLLFVAIGAVALFMAQSYPLGSAARMGPGYFPRLLGVALVTLGCLQCLMAVVSTPEPGPRLHLGTLATLLVGIGLFTLLVGWLGLVVAAIALVIVSSAASAQFRWKEAVLSGVIQGVAAATVFVYGLGLPLRVWPAFIVGE